MKDAGGRAALHNYYARYAEIARKENAGFILESPTWRASSDWGEKLGYSEEALARANRDSIALMQELRKEFETELTPVVVSGCVGPRRAAGRPAVGNLLHRRDRWEIADRSELAGSDRTG